MANKRTYKLLNNVGIVLLFIIMVSGTVQYLAPHFSWSLDGVRSGSMSPVIKRGALVIGQPVKPENVAANDIIIFRPASGDGNLIVHRVIKIENNSALRFITKGDTSAISDPYPVPAANVVARVIFHPPLLGFIAIFFSTPVGFVVAIVLPGATLVIVLGHSILSEVRKRKVVTGK